MCVYIYIYIYICFILHCYAQNGFHVTKECRYVNFSIKFNHVLYHAMIANT